jgi:hypothetical protein
VIGLQVEGADILSVSIIQQLHYIHLEICSVSAAAINIDSVNRGRHCVWKGGGIRTARSAPRAVALAGQVPVPSSGGGVAPLAAGDVCDDGDACRYKSTIARELRAEAGSFQLMTFSEFQARICLQRRLSGPGMCVFVDVQLSRLLPRRCVRQ